MFQYQLAVFFCYDLQMKYNTILNVSSLVSSNSYRQRYRAIERLRHPLINLHLALWYTYEEQEEFWLFFLDMAGYNHTPYRSKAVRQKSLVIYLLKKQNVGLSAWFFGPSIIGRNYSYFLCNSENILNFRRVRLCVQNLADIGMVILSTSLPKIVCKGPLTGYHELVFRIHEELIFF